MPGLSLGSGLERCVLFGGSGAVGTAALFNSPVLIPGSYTHLLHLLVSPSGVSGEMSLRFRCTPSLPPPCVWALASSALSLHPITHPQDTCFSLFGLVITLPPQIGGFDCYRFFPFCIHFLPWERKDTKAYIQSISLNWKASLLCFFIFLNKKHVIFVFQSA